jgi:hypothetical protein
MRLLTAIAGGLLLLLSACSSPTQAPPTARPWPAEPPYVWPDSLPRYFPAEAGVNPDHIKFGDTLQRVPIARLSDCHGQYEFAAKCLVAFGAPVLQGKYTGHPVYRFIWLRSFDRPVLLTLQGTSNGGVLRTEFLSKSPGVVVPELDTAVDLKQSLEIQARLRARWRKWLADSAFMASFRAEVAFAKAPVRISSEKSVRITATQFQEFDKRLRQANFQSLGSCLPSAGVLDGAYWFLEARNADGYHVVFRHSPDESGKFSQCCEYLLNLSPARNEERY